MAEYTQDEVMNMSSEDASKAFADLLAQAQNDNSDEEKKDEITTENTDDTDTNSDESLDKNDKISDNSSDVNSDSDQSDGQDDQLSNNDNENETTEPDSNEQQEQQQTYQVKANGQLYNVTLDELVNKLAPKAFNYTKKMQKLAPFRRSVSAMQENGITEDDLNQLIEMKKGNKVAIANFLEKNGIDTYDVSNVDSNEASKYQALKYGREQTALQQTVEELSDHPRYKDLVSYVTGLDAASKALLSEKPEGLRYLMNDIENGYFDKIVPEANKRAMMDGGAKSAFDHYVDVAQEQYQAAEAKAKAKQKQVDNRARDNSRDQTRLSGNKGSTSKAPKKQFNSVDDVTEDDLRAFEKAIGFI